MKKAVFCSLLLAPLLLGSAVKADLLPDYPIGTHAVKIINVLQDVTSYPDRTFFNFTVGLVYGVSFELISDDGKIACGYKSKQVRAIQDASKLDAVLDALPAQGRPFLLGQVQEGLREEGAILLFDITCEEEGRDGIDPQERTNYLTITSGMLPR